MVSRSSDSECSIGVKLLSETIRSMSSAYTLNLCVGDRQCIMGKAHKNCIIGSKFCLHHITGTAFIIRLTLSI